MLAAQEGHDEVVDVLIKYDADVLVTDKVRISIGLLFLSKSR